jgi:hypothetical protein
MLNMMTHTCYPSYLGNGVRRVPFEPNSSRPAWSTEQEFKKKKKSNSDIFKGKSLLRLHRLQHILHIFLPLMDTSHLDK